MNAHAEISGLLLGTTLSVGFLAILGSTWDSSSRSAMAAPTVAPIIVDSTQQLYLRALTFYGDYAFGSNHQGLVVLDVSDPGAPTYVTKLVLGDLRTPALSGQFRVPVKNGYAYVPGWNLGLFVVDVSNPEVPVEVAQLPTPRPVRALALDGDVIYMAGGDNAPLLSADISNPLAPVLAGSSTTLLAPAYEIVISDSRAYIPAGRLYIYDVSDPVVPTFLAVSFDPAWSHGVTVRGQQAFIADLQDQGFSGLGGLGAFDVSDPSNPLLLGNANAHQNDKDLFVAGNFAYMANNLLGLHATDISDPGNPTVLKWYSPVYAVETVTIHGGFLYASTDWTGLLLYALDARGDCNGDGVVNASDLIWQIGFIFKSGPPPVPLAQGDANCLDDITLADVVYLANYIFKSGTPPVCP